jgi:GalNAc-alpha-(1->4)-GalNAc-alpha-(1->3)-diNAcBac-PP-undecaprenol alpha-1,4-N-acetyl-D-galactosaminyltransferase
VRILLVIGSLRAGGAERVMSLLATELERRGHELALLTLSPPSDDFFPVPQRVRRLSIGLEGESRGPLHGVRMNLRRVAALRRCFARERPEVVVSFLTTMNVLCCTASLGAAHRLVVSERVDPSTYSAGRAWDVLRALAYRRAAVLVVQTESVARWFRAAGGPGSPPVVVIPNPVRSGTGPRNDPGGQGTDPSTAVAQPRYLLGIGRLEAQKGFDLLIDAFARLAASRPGLELRIAGAGSLRAELERRAAQRGVAARVRFLGQVADTAALLRGASVFALPSRFEGFPNALLEALACGVPSVAADCPTGPRELIGADERGLLVPRDDVDALTSAVARLLDDAALAAGYAAAGPAAARRYAVDAIADQWEAALRGGAPA